MDLNLITFEKITICQGCILVRMNEDWNEADIDDGNMCKNLILPLRLTTYLHTYTNTLFAVYGIPSLCYMTDRLCSH